MHCFVWMSSVTLGGGAHVGPPAGRAVGTPTKDGPSLHLSPAVFGFSVACLVSLGLTPLVRSLATRFQVRALRDRPGPRKVHLAARPHVGGLAVLAALTLSMAATSLAFDELTPALAPVLAGLIPAALIVAAAGLIDDLRGCGPTTKLIAQLFALAVLQSQVDVLGLGSSGAASAWQPWSALLLVPWFVGLTNAMNLIDGMDGLASGVAVISGIGLVVLAVALADPVGATIAAVLVGASLGFLRSNAHPAKIFLGDTGSMLLGFVLATTGALILWRRPDPSTFVALVLISWVPFLDTGYAVVRRSLSRVSIFRPDQGHIHHRLLRAGFSQKLAGASLWGLSGLAATAGIMVALGSHPWTWAGTVLVATLPLGWVLRPAALRGVRSRLDLGGPLLPRRRVVSQDRAA